MGSKVVAVFCVLWLLGACAKRDPLYCDEETPCTDPALPFCDLTGEHPASEGVGRTCIPDPFPDGGVPAGEVELTVVKTGAGGGDIVSTPAGIECGSTCTATFPEGTEVTLTPEADSSSTFIGWQNDCSGLAPCSLALASDSIASARFEPRGLHQRTKTLGTDGYEAVRFVGFDSNDNRIIAGTFAGTITLGSLEPLVSEGANDVFAAAYSPNGEYIWAISWGDTESNSVSSAALDGDDLVIATLPALIGGPELRILRVQSGGSITLNKAFQSTSRFHNAEVAVDKQRRLIVGGSFSGTVDFGGTPLVGDNSSATFVARLTADGEHLSSVTFGVDGTSAIRGVAVDDSDSIYITGDMSVGLDFGGGMLATSGDYDVFLVKLDSNGSQVWSKSFGGPGREWGGPIAVADGSVSIGGSYSDQADFGSGPLEGATMSQSSRAFVGSYTTASGSHRWSNGWGPRDGGNSSTASLTIGPRGFIYAGGSAGVIDFGTGELSEPGDAWLVSMHPETGATRWATIYGGDDTGVFSDSTASLAVNAATVVGAGGFYGTGSFGGQTAQNAGDSDAFVVEFSP